MRTLHYYDQIGLLKPAAIKDSGYRLYNDESLETLQQILFFKELGFPLKQIKEILNNPRFDKMQALTNHKQLLTMKRNRLNKLLNLIDDILKGENIMSFKEFDVSELEKTMNEYSKEAKELYSGKTKEYSEYKQKSSGYNKEDWYRIDKEGTQIFSEFVGVMDKGADSKEAQTLVKKWQDYISQNFYSCTKEILSCLGQMYTTDERFTENIDKNKPGLAAFISQAIEYYCKN